jgi:hypothetical protein
MFNDARFGLTAEKLRSRLHYCPDTGEWSRLVKMSNRPIGSPVGSLKPSGYLLLDVDGHRYRSHRLVWLYMTGAWPVGEIDHRNTVRSDNRWENLRLASEQQNQANSSKPRDNTSGFKGVYWNKQQSKWAEE